MEPVIVIGKPAMNLSLYNGGKTEHLLQKPVNMTSVVVKGWKNVTYYKGKKRSNLLKARKNTEPV